MSWRILVLLGAKLVPLLVEALRDGRLSAAELQQLVDALLHVAAALVDKQSA